MKLFSSSNPETSINSTDLLKRPLWNRDKINFYFKVNPNTNENKLETYSFSIDKVNIIEKSQQFKDFNYLTYEQMLETLINSKISFNNRTEQLVEEIITVPHNEHICKITNITLNDRYIVMVDGSKKTKWKTNNTMCC